MKTLYLLRHTKSSWKDETLPDIERPLNGRGRKASQTLGSFLRTKGIVPDLVLSSPALRARQTTGLVLEAAGITTDLRFDERIYEASAQKLLGIIRQIEKSKKTVLLVGHNPGLEELLELLTGKPEKVTTGTLSKILVTCNWAELGDGVAALEYVLKPKALEKS